jgi:hypothetical protein
MSKKPAGGSPQGQLVTLMQPLCSLPVTRERARKSSALSSMRRNTAKRRAGALLAVLTFGAPAAYSAQKHNDLRIVIETIDHSKQRYPTVGDWQIGKAGNLHITVSKMSDQRYEFLVAAHEMIEAYLAIHAGVSPKAVDRFDKAYEANRKPGDDSEPGDDPRAPYHKQHVFAENVERLLAAELGVDWQAYDHEVSSK